MSCGSLYITDDLRGGREGLPVWFTVSCGSLYITDDLRGGRETEDCLCGLRESDVLPGFNRAATMKA